MKISKKEKTRLLKIYKLWGLLSSKSKLLVLSWVEEILSDKIIQEKGSFKGISVGKQDR